MQAMEVTVQGLVQGIGYRPFVAELAEQLHIVGWVRNTNGIVTVFAAAEPEILEQFATDLQAKAPEGAEVTGLSVKKVPLPANVPASFTIIGSNSEERGELPRIPADLPTCRRCTAELKDPSNRRYRHPFISCTACGPRYSILDALPYDRDTIAMKDFPMCDACKAEYTEKGNVRRHAQTICCPDCGPRLSFLCYDDDFGGMLRKASGSDECIKAAAGVILAGGIAAVKDIGGYHLAASPFSDETVEFLRKLKHREKKPFAVMFADENQAADYCEINEAEKKLLLSAPRPIVLLKKKKNGKALAEGVCGTSPDIGAMLPCNPVQIMLTEICGPLIMTSANASGQLLFRENEPMEQWLNDRLDDLSAAGERTVPVCMLAHDRPIRTSLDDSIMRVVCGKTQILRRARGMVPEPLPFPYPGKIFAAGGDLKACFAYAEHGQIILSPHLGDLEEMSCQTQYVSETARMKKLFGFRPETAACDRHPAYISAGLLAEAAGTSEPAGEIFRIQHHEAHAASVIAEHQLTGQVLCFAFDGTGYGDDGSIWGSECFLWNGKKMERTAHLKPVRLIGGDEGARNCDSILYGYLQSFSQESRAELEKVLEKQYNLHKQQYSLVSAAIANRINTVTSTSMGRLFDAVSAFLGICHYNSYEGEAPVELENLACTTAETIPLPVSTVETENAGHFCWNTEELFRTMGRALNRGIPAAVIARSFLLAVAEMVMQVARKEAVRQVALSGGTFLNRILLETLTGKLAEEGFEAYRNEAVPPGDGGLCLGQAWLAAQQVKVTS